MAIRSDLLEYRYDRARSDAKRAAKETPRWAYCTFQAPFNLRSHFYADFCFSVRYGVRFPFHVQDFGKDGTLASISCSHSYEIIGRQSHRARSAPPIEQERRCPAFAGALFLAPSILGHYRDIWRNTLYIRLMLTLSSVGLQIATKRKALGLTRPVLAKKARVGLSTLEALENGRLGELGYSKVTNILSALGLELKLQEARASRPTLDQLMDEERDAQGLDRLRRD